MKFLVWDPSQGMFEADAHVIEAYDLKDAAELYAERWAGFYSAPFEELCVAVKAPSGRVYHVDVDVELAPLFSARAPREVSEEEPVQVVKADADAVEDVVLKTLGR